jgi:hypothetical protein
LAAIALATQTGTYYSGDSSSAACTADVLRFLLAPSDSPSSSRPEGAGGVSWRLPTCVPRAGRKVLTETGVNDVRRYRLRFSWADAPPPLRETLIEPPFTVMLIAPEMPNSALLNSPE